MKHLYENPSSSPACFALGRSERRPASASHKHTRTWLAGLFALSTAACSFNEQTHCSQASDCANGQECYHGFCVSSADSSDKTGAINADSQDSGSKTGKGASSAGHAAGSGGRRGPKAAGANAPSAAGESSSSDGEHSGDNMSSDSTAGAAGMSTSSNEGTADAGPASGDPAGSASGGTGGTAAGGGKGGTGGVTSGGAGKSAAGSEAPGCTPKPETCANEGADDDCNGVKDDVPQRDARCTVAANKGPCMSGQLQCKAGSPELQCVTPAATTETCNGKDDDCDGTVDNGFDLKTDKQRCGSCDKACASGEMCCQGKCASSCGGGAAGMMSMPPAGGAGAGAAGASAAGQAAPGGCGKCAAGEECCDGKCTSTTGSDVKHCGSCTTVCGGALPGCCTGRCVDLKADDYNCGTCGNACGLLSLGGIACKCGTLGSGEAQCVGVDVAGLLQLCL